MDSARNYFFCLLLDFGDELPFLARKIFLSTEMVTEQLFSLKQKELLVEKYK